MEWTYEDKIITEIPSEFKDYHGFIYIVSVAPTEDDTRMHYVGYKSIVNADNKKVGKRELAKLKKDDPTNWRKGLNYYKGKGKKNKDDLIYYRKGVKSTWREYNGSCTNPLYTEKIEQGLLLRKTILMFTESKLHTSYYESKFLFGLGAIEKEDYYNANIGGKYHRSRLFN